MTYEMQNWRQIMRWRIVAKAVQSFDQKSQVIVLASWAAAIFALFLSLYTVNLAFHAKQNLALAAVGEPSLPLLVTKEVTPEELKVQADRLDKMFPGISAQLGKGGTMVLTASDGSYFRTWLTALGYLDMLSPQLRWRLAEFCVGGACGNTILMRAVLTAEKNTFMSPN